MNTKLAVVVVLVTGMTWACPKGTEEHEGACAALLAPYEGPGADIASKEKPPTDKMPSYQREGIHADMPESLKEADEEYDRKINRANMEGRKAAGLE